jgi:hypothetical protein
MPKTHSVEVDVDAFCGWPFLLDLVKTASTGMMQALLAALFETGGRISEVVAPGGLRRRNIDLTLHPGVVVVKQMPLLKRFEKVGTTAKWKCVGHCNRRWSKKPDPSEFQEHKIKKYAGWVTKTILDHRTFPFRRDEPLAPYFISWVERVKNPNSLLFPINRSAVFVRVRNIGIKLNQSIPLSNIPSTELYDHWFRSERASQLAFDYGFQKEDLDEFFDWKERRPSMSSKYAGLGWIGLARKMGVNVEIKRSF